MINRIFKLTVAGLLSCLLSVALVTASYADSGYYADRMSREHRVASDVDEWIERGNATITASPLFEDGMRLTAWANTSHDMDNYEFAIASGVYLFEIPRNAQSIEILVRYKGEPHTFEIQDYDEPIAGKIWIRNIRREATRRGYHDKSATETRYGDTFILRANRRSETIKIPAAGHVENGWMELHIVAEGGEQLDIEYIEVSTYRRAPKVRVVHRYTPTYRWRPWHRYTYLYFYDGPFYYTNGYDSYFCWSYPVYDHRYLSIRAYYGNYLVRYRSHHPALYGDWHTPYYDGYYTSYRANRKRTQLNRWSAAHENTRKRYTRSRLAAQLPAKERTTVQNDVRSTIRNHRKQIPSTTERLSRDSLIYQRRLVRDTSTLQPRRYTNRSSYSTRTPERQSGQRLDSRADSDTRRRYSPSSTDRRTRSLTSSRTRSSSSTPNHRSLDTWKRQRTPSVTPSSSRTTPSKSRSTTRSSTSSSRKRPTATRSSSSRTSSDDDDDDDDDRRRSTRRIQSRRK